MLCKGKGIGVLVGVVRVGIGLSVGPWNLFPQGLSVELL